MMGSRPFSQWRATVPSLWRSVLLSLVSTYLRLTPLRYGAHRLMTYGARLLGPVPRVGVSRDGRKFLLQFPRDRGWERLYFARTFETGTTELLGRLLRPSDVTFDVGANIGWYTTLFAAQCPRGRCHAFEPEPEIFEELARNCALNGIAERVKLNNLGLGATGGATTIYRFAGVPHGHTSLSSQVGADARGVGCRITTVDEYCVQRGLKRVDLIKVDVEGAELGVLQGAQSLLASGQSPIWVFEVNYLTSRAFGYAPPDLFRHLSEREAFRFFRVVQGGGRVLPMRSVSDCGQSDNVLCVPPAHQDRIAWLR